MSSQTSNQITHTLHSLLPSYTRRKSGDGELDFPRSLVQLTHALLQQSKARVPRLKAEEEVGRCWVVAEIACHRLKTRLNLPAIESRPPCPPKVYKKLYAYLESVLKDEKEVGGFAATRIAGVSSRTPSKGASVTSSQRANGKLNGDLPVGSPQSAKRIGEIVESNCDSERSAQKRRKLADIPLGSSGEVVEGLADDIQMDSQSEAEQFVDAEEFPDDQNEDAVDGLDGEVVSLTSIGHGSLMESRFDWLSDKRRKDYEKWKADILKRIEVMEKPNKNVKSRTKGVVT